MSALRPLLSPAEFRKLFEQTRAFATEDIQKSWFHLLITLALCGGSTFVASRDMLPIWLRISASLLTAFLYMRLFILYHDYEHGAIFSRSFVGGILMKGVGLFLLRPSYDWRRTHNFHHQNNTIFRTADVGSFPVMTLAQYKEASASKRFEYRVIRHSLVIFLGYLTCFVLETFKKMFLKDFRLLVEALGSVLLHLAFLWWCFSYGVVNGLIVGLMPHFVSSMVGVYLFYLQHNFEGADFLPDEQWDYGYAALNSSSFIQSGALFRFFSGNIGFHHIHHLNHKIPFYRLPEAMNAIEALQHPVTIRLSPMTIWRSLNLKLWDAEQRKFVGYPL